MSYDRAITIFSPDGHLFQVEYGLEAVKKGSAALGIRGKSCIVICAEKKSIPKLQDDKSIRKIAFLDEHIVMTFAGLNADGRILIDKGQVECQSYKLTMEDPITVEYLARHITKIKQRYTQSNGRRPFGVTAVIGGINYDGTPKLFQTEPSGTFYEWKAAAVGRNAKIITEYLEKNYNEDVVSSEDGALQLAAKSITEVVQSGAQNLEIVVLSKNKKKPSGVEHRYLTMEEKEKLLKGVEADKKAEAEERKKRGKSATTTDQ